MRTQNQIPAEMLHVVTRREGVRTIFFVQLREWGSNKRWVKVIDYGFLTIEACQDYIAELEDSADKMDVYQFEYRIKEEEA